MTAWAQPTPMPPASASLTPGLGHQVASASPARHRPAPRDRAASAAGATLVTEGTVISKPDRRRPPGPGPAGSGDSARGPQGRLPAVLEPAGKARPHLSPGHWGCPEPLLATGQAREPTPTRSHPAVASFAPLPFRGRRSPHLRISPEATKPGRARSVSLHSQRRRGAEGTLELRTLRDTSLRPIRKDRPIA